MTAIGIDIGTTTISINLVDIDNGHVEKCITIPNKSHVKAENNFDDLQDPEYILLQIKDVLDEIISCYTDIKCIGIAGQMHGIIYTDQNGMSIGPLYTWRHLGGNEKYPDKGITYSEYLTRLTGYQSAAGYGFTTIFFHGQNGMIPSNAVSFCSVSDYISMRLTNTKKACVHISNAHSFGMFNFRDMNFDFSAIDKCGINIDTPVVTSEFIIVGEYKGIPVSVGIGDNQAGFIGSVKDMENSVLLNMGTGSQISFISRDLTPYKEMEVRPLIKDLFIHAGCSLCGGFAFAVLERFFRKTAELVCGINVESAYPGIDELINKILKERKSIETSINVSTLFRGTRNKPDLRGSITNITSENLTPEDILIGFVHGMVKELYDLYKGTDQNHSILVGAGNGLSRNVLMQKAVFDMFGIDVCIPVHVEQTAYGAALFAMVSAGLYKRIEDAQCLIKYRQR